MNNGHDYLSEDLAEANADYEKVAFLDNLFGELQKFVSDHWRNEHTIEDIQMNLVHFKLDIMESVLTTHLRP